MRRWPARWGFTLAIVTWLLCGFAPLTAALQQETTPDAAATEAAEPERPVKRIRMYAENWKWTPNTIRVAAGTQLRIEVENIDSPHRFEIKKLGVKVQLPEDSKTTIEFLADQPGTFRWRCTRPCGNGCPKMTGKLIVEEADAG